MIQLPSRHRMTSSCFRQLSSRIYISDATRSSLAPCDHLTSDRWNANNGAICSIQRSELVDYVSSRMKTTPARDLKCYELGPNASTAVSVIKHRDLFQLICRLYWNLLGWFTVSAAVAMWWTVRAEWRVANGRRDEHGLTFEPTVFQSVLRGEKDRNAVPVVKKGTGTAFRCVPVANHPWTEEDLECCRKVNIKSACLFSNTVYCI
jgi:hypothetical protein